MWVTSTDWVDSNNRSWAGSGNNRTLDMGTWTLRGLVPGNYSPKCAEGYVYSITGNGQLRQITPNGTVSDIGSQAPTGSYYNGLGVGSGGEPVYAILRSGGSGTDLGATVYRFDTTTGQWSSTGASRSSTGTNLVGGAVDLSTGIYYFGGFTSSGNFTAYQYNPATNAITLKGT